jgi:hypothetical protein
VLSYLLLCLLPKPHAHALMAICMWIPTWHHWVVTELCQLHHSLWIKQNQYVWLSSSNDTDNFQGDFNFPDIMTSKTLLSFDTAMSLTLKWNGKMSQWIHHCLPKYSKLWINGIWGDVCYGKQCFKILQECPTNGLNLVRLNGNKGRFSSWIHSVWDPGLSLKLIRFLLWIPIVGYSVDLKN